MPTVDPVQQPGVRSEVERITWISLAINLGVGVIKIALGLLGHSWAVVADGVHSLSDLVTDAAVLVGVRYWSAPADFDHPHGHARIETLVTVLIGGATAAVGVGLAWQAIQHMIRGDGLQPTWVALAAAAASCIIKEGLYRWTIHVGRDIGSSAVIANAVHHRSDALSSVPATAAVTATLVLGPDWWWLDSAGAVVVSVLILYAAWTVIRPAVDQLVDHAAPADEVERFRDIASTTPGVSGAHDLRTRYVGTRIALDLHIEVHPQFTVHHGHEIADAVRNRLYASTDNLCDVVIHIDPAGIEETDKDH